MGEDDGAALIVDLPGFRDAGRSPCCSKRCEFVALSAPPIGINHAAAERREAELPVSVQLFSTKRGILEQHRAALVRHISRQNVIPRTGRTN